jgi:hypothetical protein
LEKKAQRMAPAEMDIRLKTSNLVNFSFKIKVAKTELKSKVNALVELRVTISAYPKATTSSSVKDNYLYLRPH